MNYKTSIVIAISSAWLLLSARADITNGLVLYLPLDETSGTTAFDSSGNGYNATHVNGPTDNSQWTSGWTGGAIKINNPFLAGDACHTFFFTLLTGPCFYCSDSNETYTFESN